MSEWSKESVLKTDSVQAERGFESHSILYNNIIFLLNNNIKKITIQYTILSILFFVFIISYFGYFIFFFLLPISVYTTNINSTFLNTYYLTNMNIDNNYLYSNYIYNLEINLPFFTSEYLYVNILIICIIMLIVPYCYYTYIQYTKSTIFKYEYYMQLINSYYFLFSCITAYMIIYLNILPLILKWLFTHYNNLLFFEFDIQFNIQIYLFLFIKLVLIILLYICTYNNIKNISLSIHYLSIYFIINISDYLIMCYLFITIFLLIRYFLLYKHILLRIKLINFYSIIIQRKCNV